MAGSSHVVLDVEQVIAGAAHDLEQVVHRRDLLELLVDEPLQEAAREVVALLDGEVHEVVEGPGDAQLGVERELDGDLDGVEVRIALRDGGHLDNAARLRHVVDDLLGVHQLLGDLDAEQRGELRERLAAEVGGDHRVLDRGPVLVRQVVAECLRHPFGDQHWPVLSESMYLFYRRRQWRTMHGDSGQ